MYQYFFQSPKFSLSLSIYSTEEATKEYLVGDIKANPRDFYRYINSQKKDAQGISPLKRRNGSGLAESELEQADEFNGQLTGVLNRSEHTQQIPIPSRSAPFMEDIHVSAEGVTKLLKGLNPRKL